MSGTPSAPSGSAAGATRPVAPSGEARRAAVDAGLARVGELVAGGASAAEIEVAIRDEAAACTGAAIVLLCDANGVEPDHLLARAALQGRRTALEGDVDAPRAMAAPLGTGHAGQALVARAAPGSALVPGSEEALARVALVGGTGLAGARAAQLVESGMSIGSDLDVDVVLRRVLESARRIVGARYAALGVLSDDGSGLARFIWSGLDDATAMNIGRLPQGRGLLGLLITEPHPIRVDHMGGHPASSGFPAGHPPMESFLGVPVMLGDQVFGNLYLTDREGGPFRESDERVAVTLAAQAATAIANARRVMEERTRLVESAALAAARERELAAAEGHRRAIRAQEAERLRVSRELHDETGQVLTAVALELAALDAHLDDEGRALLAEARRTLASASEGLRDLAIRLRPSGLAEYGLANAIERQAERLRDPGGITVDVAVTGLPADLPEEVEIAIYRVVQEALTNVQRHAGATTAGVLVTGLGDRVRVLVEDDGVGFDPATATDRLGLAGIRERIALVGGTAIIDSAPGTGTTVAVEFPLHAGRGAR